MATQAEILDLFQNIGSVRNSDYVLIHVANGNSAGKVTMEVLRAYLNADFAISVNENGYLVIGDEVTSIKFGTAIRVGENGLEVSNDGQTFIPLISFASILDRGIVCCTEERYAEMLANNEIDPNKYYATYEE